MPVIVLMALMITRDDIDEHGFSNRSWLLAAGRTQPEARGE